MRKSLGKKEDSGATNSSSYRAPMAALRREIGAAWRLKKLGFRGEIEGVWGYL
jgi:hypothetical protein